MFTEQLPDLDYIYSLLELSFVGDMNIHFVNPLLSLTKQTVTTLSLHNLVLFINKSTHRCSHIIDWVVVGPNDVIRNLLLQTHLNQTIIGLVVRMSILDTEVDGSNPSISMFSP